jgi:hypothetical protein
MKKFEKLGKSLSKEEQKVIAGGVELPPACLSIGESCNDNVQCCSNNCAPTAGSSTTGKVCKVSA